MSRLCLAVMGAVVLLVTAGSSAAGELGALLKEKNELKNQVEAVKKEFDPKVKPLEEQLSALRKEIREKTKDQNERLRKIDEEVAAGFQKLLPTGKQSYGDFKWECSASSWISVRAKDSSGKQMVWVQVFYTPDITPEEQKEYGSKVCCGLPAKRFKDKWVWVQAGRIEMRFGLSDSSLESDATLDAIVASFNLDAIKAL